MIPARIWWISGPAHQARGARLDRSTAGRAASDRVEVREPSRCGRICAIPRRVAATPPVEAFMNAASPGVIALFQPNEYLPHSGDYLVALAEALRMSTRPSSPQVSCCRSSPDLAMGGHTIYRSRSLEEFARLAEPAHRSAESCAAQCAGGARAHARVLGQLRRPASP